MVPCPGGRGNTGRCVGVGGPGLFLERGPTLERGTRALYGACMIDRGMLMVWVFAASGLVGCLSDGGGGALDQSDSSALDGLGDLGGGDTDGVGEDTGGDAGADTGMPDTGGDTGVDTSVPDTGGDTGADTGVPDTGGDTGVPDTGGDMGGDTGVADTGPGDVVSPAADPGVVGPLSFTSSEVEVGGFDGRFFVPTVSVKVPAVVLAPGFSLDAATLRWLAEHLASHGFAVLLVDFGDSPFSPLTHDALGTAMVEAVTWLAADPKVDAAKIAVGGHSRGGKAAMLAAARDGRVNAVVGLDPVDAPPPLTQPNASYPSVTPELMGQVSAALLLVGSEYGPTAASIIAPACAPADDNFEQYAQHASAAMRVLVEEIPKSGHNDFADPVPTLLAGACKAGDQPATTRGRVRTLVVAFLQVVLSGDSRYEAWL